ncbi:hypothetical protein H2248_007282 [Termitomyces sp. 'cryptogamus']|nr:hypothetical protein H2248_007282 [Termitomyces sp. 'cryptogamus']
MNPVSSSDLQPFVQGALLPGECFWRDHYHYLQKHGYTLRKRYHPEWKPSWLTSDSTKSYHECEDFCTLGLYACMLDASRSDGSLVALKRLKFPVGLGEMTIGTRFSSSSLFADPRNHCIPILDIILPMPGSDVAFIVMPLLRQTRIAPFETVGEAVEYFRQIFEGLQFMHENNTIHGDCKHNNIMEDGLSLYTTPPHPFKHEMRRDFIDRTPKPVSRTIRPTKYYLIDFGLSYDFTGEDGPHLLQGPWGGYKNVPEHQGSEPPPCDPFPVDVYCIGNLINQHFLDGVPNPVVPFVGFEFMRELVSDMMNKDPKKRPTMDEVVFRFDLIVKGLSWYKLRSPVIRADELRWWDLSCSITHWVKQTYYILRGYPAIPRVS